MQSWYVLRQGQALGPFAAEQLHEMAQAGKLLPDELVSYPGAKDWLPARSVPGLFAPAAREHRRSLVRALLSLPKPLLFATFGGVGGLLAALLLGELLWALLSPAAVRAEARTRLAVPQGVRVYQGGKNRFAVKIARDGFQGPVRIEAVDPPEGVVVPFVTVPEEQDEAAVDVEVLPGSAVPRHALVLRARATGTQAAEPAQETIELVVEPTPAQLALSVPASVSLYQGSRGRFRLLLGRSHAEGPVTVHLEGVPAGVRAAEVRVPPGGDDQEAELVASSDAAAGTVVIRAVAYLADRPDVKASANFEVNVRPAPLPQADVLFVLDLTGSMQFAIDGVKDGIEKFVAALGSRRIDARIGLVGFRDIESDNERPFVMKVRGSTFTKDHRAFREEMRKLRANGGGDAPESSFQGLALAAAQEFRPNAARVLLLITDAPPKIHAGESPSTLTDTLKALTGAGVNQLHLVVRLEDYDDPYKGFHKKLKGTFIDLARLAGDSSGLAAALPRLGEDISLLTVAAAPAAPGVAEGPPPPAPATPPAVAPAATVPVLKAIQSTQAYTAEHRGQLLLALALWTTVISAGISLMIVAGQQFAACQRWVSVSEGTRALVGGALAGALAGAAGQLLFQSSPGGTTWDVASRLLGWGLLGGLVGAGMGTFVPNLKWQRGLAGGVIGGVLGAVSFLLAGTAAGAFTGRWIGAGVLGFFIGLMVALAEVAFRRWWLEIAFGPREVRTFTLGATPVSLGGDERRVSVLVAGCPPIALRYRLDGERVLCQDVVAERTFEVSQGDQRALGKVVVTVRSAEHARQAGHTLRLSSGASFRLVEGLPLTAEDVPGLQAEGADRVVAVVGTRPNDPSVLLLRNRSRQSWALIGSDGSRRVLASGGAVELSFDGIILFGNVEGTFRRENN